MSNLPYYPRENSVCAKVISFLKANPDERLDADLISAKCDCDRRSVHTLLGQAVQAGLLRRSEDLESGELIYSLGAAVLPSKPAPSLSSPVPQRRERSAPFTIDLDSVKVEKGIPLVLRGAGMNWAPLFDKLEVGDSFALPQAARSTIRGAIQHYIKASEKVLTWRTRGDEIRVWRTK